MKYIKDKDWDTYLLDYLESIKKNIQDIPKDPNKGIQFEVLVEYLLSQMFTAEELCFKNTKLSHDGNKDFGQLMQQMKYGGQNVRITLQTLLSHN